MLFFLQSCNPECVVKYSIESFVKLRFELSAKIKRYNKIFYILIIENINLFLIFKMFQLRELVVELKNPSHSYKFIIFYIIIF